MKKLCPNCEGVLEYAVDHGPHRPGRAYCPKCRWQGRFQDGLSEPASLLLMPYVSIDIETTGLDPETCQILEVGAVWDDGRPINELPIFHRYVTHPSYHGDPYALAMNAAILKTLSNPCGHEFVPPSCVADDFSNWLKTCGWDGKTSLTPAGKNFASFDRQFLKRLPRFEVAAKLSHRSIDPAILFLKPGDTKLPDSKTCYERAGLDRKVAHTAVEDALAVVRLVRIGIKRLR